MKRTFWSISINVFFSLVFDFQRKPRIWLEWFIGDLAKEGNSHPDVGAPLKISQMFIDWRRLFRNSPRWPSSCAWNVERWKSRVKMRSEASQNCWHFAQLENGFFFVVTTSKREQSENKLAQLCNEESFGLLQMCDFLRSLNEDEKFSSRTFFGHRPRRRFRIIFLANRSATKPKCKFLARGKIHRIYVNWKSRRRLSPSFNGNEAASLTCNVWNFRDIFHRAQPVPIIVKVMARYRGGWSR